MRLVIVESPFAGRAPRWARFFPLLAWLIARVLQARNVAYARAAVRDCVLRGEAPIASHLLFTQPGILRDDVPAERAAGIEAGLAWGSAAHFTAAYIDLGISRGMEIGMEHARRDRRTVVTRRLPGWAPLTRMQLAVLAATLLVVIAGAVAAVVLP